MILMRLFYIFDPPWKGLAERRADMNGGLGTEGPGVRDRSSEMLNA